MIKIGCKRVRGVYERFVANKNLLYLKQADYAEQLDAYYKTPETDDFLVYDTDEFKKNFPDILLNEEE